MIKNRNKNVLLCSLHICTKAVCMKKSSLSPLFFITILIAIFVGGCSFRPDPHDNIPWKVKNISHAGCSQLNGVYRVESENYIDAYNAYFAFEDIRLSKQRYREEYGISVFTEDFKKIPFKYGSPVAIKDVSGRTNNPVTGKPYGTHRQEDTSEFWKTAKMSISQEEQKLIVTLMDQDGVAYRRVTIGIQNQDVSCDEKRFYIRYFSEDNDDFVYNCYLTTHEVIIRKLDTGDLIMTVPHVIYNVICMGGSIKSVHFDNTKTWILKKLED